AGRKLVAAADDGRTHPLAAFAHAGVGQPDQAERGQTRTDVHLDPNRKPLEPAQGLAGQHRQRHGCHPAALSNSGSMRQCHGGRKRLGSDLSVRGRRCGAGFPYGSLAESKLTDGNLPAEVMQGRTVYSPDEAPSLAEVSSACTLASSTE